MPSYDIIIIGTGAGGGTMARALADTGARILVVERGDFVPVEAENWSPTAVWRDLRYRARERWLDEDGREFSPYIHYGVGGNTKFWGSVLYRLRREDFQATEHADGISPAWPIDYDTLAPYYDRAEALYQVHGDAHADPTEPPRPPYAHAAVPHSPEMAEIVTRLRQQGLHPSSLPLGLLNPGQPGGCVLCDTCNSFPCKLQAKSDAETCGMRPAVAVLERHAVRPTRVATAAHHVRRRPQGRCRGGRAGWRNPSPRGARLFVVSCGAVNSAALLLRSATEPTARRPGEFVRAWSARATWRTWRR